MCKCNPEIRTPFCGAVGCEWPETENKENIDRLKLALKTLKHDYWFMTNLLEHYSTNKEQAIEDCIKRMKFRKPLFNVLDEDEK